MRRFLLIFLVVAVSCTSNTEESVPPDIIQPEPFSDILVDMHLADATLNVVALNKTHRDYNPQGYYNQVLKKSGVTRVDFEKSIDWYTKYPETLGKVYEEVINKLSMMEGTVVEGKVTNPFNEEIDKPKELHYFLDFEVRGQNLFDHYRSSMATYSGTKSMFIGANHSHSPAIYHLISTQIKKLKIDMRFFIHIGAKPGDKGPQVVVSLEKDSEYLIFKEYDFIDQVSPDKLWNMVEEFIEIDCPENVKGCALKVYINNPNKQKFSVDELDIKLRFE